MPPSFPPRSHRSPAERDARSRLVKRCAEAPLLRGSLVTMRRVCGKPGCRCNEGEKHVSLYLAIRYGKRRKMIYIPSELEQRVREWVQSSQEIDRLLELVSQSCLEQLLQTKEGLPVQRKKTRPRKD
jgi:hypothetical protein